MALILVAEDEAPTVEHLRSALSSQGWLVKTVSTREQAILAASEYAPQLVLINEQLSGADDLVRAFCRSSGGPGVVLLSDRADGSGSPSPAVSSADAVLEKPFHTEELIESVRQRLSSPARKKTATRDSYADRIFSSQEIFGDLIADLMADSSDPPAEVGLAIPETDRPAVPQLDPVSPAVAVAQPPETPPEKARRSVRPLEQRLDETLAGVLASTLDAPFEPDLERKSERAVDDLIRRTLSDLEPPSASSSGTAEVEAFAGLPPELTRTGPSAGLLRAQSNAVPEAEVRPVPESAPPIEDDTADADAAPREFGDYSLEERIGRGGMAEVWRATRRGVEGFEKTVAIKKILPEPADNSAFVEMLIDEAKVAAQLNHPHITHIYDLGRIEDDYFIAMEYVEGMNLRKILDAVRRGGLLLPAGLALFIASRIAGALDYAHRKRDEENRPLGLVHRDVSPQNVLIGFEGDIKLCDFGIAKAVSKVNTTQIGALKGKLQYMSPEQAWGREDIDARSDIFALGSLLFEMLSGERLFSGSSEIAVLEAVRNCRTAERLAETSGIPTQVRAVLLKALAKDPSDRFQTAGDVQKRLEEILQRLKPVPGQEQLAEFMSAVQGGTPVGEEHRPADTSDDERLRFLLETAGGVKPASAAPVASIGPPEVEPEAPVEDSGKRRRTLMIGFAVAIVVAALIALGVWLLWPRGGIGQGPVEAAGPEVAPAGIVQEVPARAGFPVSQERPEAPSIDVPEGTPSTGNGGQEGEGIDAEAVAPPPTPAATEGEAPGPGDEDLARRFEEELQRVEELLADSPFGESAAEDTTNSDGPTGR